MTTPAFRSAISLAATSRPPSTKGPANGHPADSVARALLGVVVEVYRAERGADDIRRELEFVAEHLDEDDDFEFMRP